MVSLLLLQPLLPNLCSSSQISFKFHRNYSHLPTLFSLSPSKKQSIPNRSLSTITFALAESDSSKSLNQEQTPLLLQEIADSFALPSDYFAQLPSDLRLDLNDAAFDLANGPVIDECGRELGEILLNLSRAWEMGDTSTSSSIASKLPSLSGSLTDNAKSAFGKRLVSSGRRFQSMGQYGQGELQRIAKAMIKTGKLFSATPVTTASEKPEKETRMFKFGELQVALTSDKANIGAAIAFVFGIISWELSLGIQNVPESSLQYANDNALMLAKSLRGALLTVCYSSTVLSMVSVVGLILLGRQLKSKEPVWFDCLRSKILLGLVRSVRNGDPLHYLLRRSIPNQPLKEGGIPLLMLAEKMNNATDKARVKTRKFLSLSDNKVHNLDLPGAHGQRCWGSPFGWTGQYIVMIIHSGGQSLSFVNSGENAWTTLKTHHGGYYRDSDGSYTDVLLFKGALFAVTCEGFLRSCTTHNQTSVIVTHITALQFTGLERVYLVEMAGKLHMVVRIVNADSVVPAQSDHNVNTTFFHVYKLDLFSLRMEWTQLKKLGDYILFLGNNNTSFSIVASDYPGCKRGRIYYTGDYSDIHGRRIGHDMGIFNLETKSFEPLYTGDDAFSWHSPPVWITPTLW
ncbi:hypothetical protein GIB67_024628 [Kingdonia uniflora]|uniref:KIB1-4 beta-propeller domain-containing protein n=1 Tax=Kingdonia uniflora TaxID=39325 RepID=A0A7J7LP09_9MAGN|nr:hypothetical protein GIB67_024628 [Kingdonia uniflora]